jgi:CubicO group peptidase (beta-lactamase class C family)
MDYKDKYIKYKTKYLELKNIDINNQMGGGKDNVIFNASKLIYNDGKTTIKNYKSTSDTMYQIASCSKFITSLVVAKLYELGKIDYDTDINKYLKKWKCVKKGVTLRHLLTHTSGSSDHNGFLGMEPQVKYTQNLELNIKILNGESYSKPFNITEKIGKKFMYSGAGFQVIQQVIEEITNKRLYQLMKQYIFTPLNMNNSTGKLLYENKQ